MFGLLDASGRPESDGLLPHLLARLPPAPASADAFAPPYVWATIVNFEFLGRSPTTDATSKKRRIDGAEAEENAAARDADPEDPDNYLVDLLVVCRADSVRSDSRETGARTLTAPVPVHPGEGPSRPSTGIDPRTLRPSCTPPINTPVKPRFDIPS